MFQLFSNDQKEFLSFPVIFINTILALIVLLTILYFTMYNLDDYTNHGVKIAVPVLVGTQINNVEDSLADYDLRFEIRTLYTQTNTQLEW